MYLTLCNATQAPAWMRDTKSTDWPMDYASIGRFFFYVAVFVLVLFMAYYATKWLASAKYDRRSGFNIQIVESFAVGYQSMLQIVRVGEKYILLGVTKDRLTMLAELDPEDIKENPQLDNFQIPFQKYLQQFMGKHGS